MLLIHLTCKKCYVLLTAKRLAVKTVPGVACNVPSSTLNPTMLGARLSTKLKRFLEKEGRVKVG